LKCSDIEYLAGGLPVHLADEVVVALVRFARDLSPDRVVAELQVSVPKVKVAGVVGGGDLNAVVMAIEASLGWELLLELDVLCV